MVSFTFGLPSIADIQALRQVGTRVLGTVTSSREARLAEAAGVDGLIVQGADAGGHSAIWEPTGNPAQIPTAELVRQVKQASSLPLLAAGGVDGPGAVRQLLGAGAQAVVVGTLLLRTDEAGTTAVHRAALADAAFAETVITRAFTGRPARSLRNRFVNEHAAMDLTAYPAVHHLTKGMRQASAAIGDPHGVHLWAGTGWRHASAGPVADVIASLAAGCR